jgi:hypothetical protein
MKPGNIRFQSNQTKLRKSLRKREILARIKEISVLEYTKKFTVTTPGRQRGLFFPKNGRSDVLAHWVPNRGITATRLTGDLLGTN